MPDNTFAPPLVDIAGNIQNLITQYRTAQLLRKKQELDTARKNALGRLLSGQEQDPVKMIMGYGQATGDIEGMQGLAKVYRQTQPGQAKVPPAVTTAQYFGNLEKQDPNNPELRYAPGGITRSAPGVSQAQIALDKRYGPDLLSWEQGGKAESEGGISTLDKAITNLETKKGISGPTVGYAVKNPKGAAGYLGYTISPDAFDTAESHKRAVINSLRPILGSRPAQQLIQSVIEATYDPSLPQELNLRRLKILRKNLESARNAKNEMAKYWDQHGTLQGYTGATPDQMNFTEGLGNEAAPAQPEATSAQLPWGITGGGQTTPAAAPADQPWVPPAETPGMTKITPGVPDEYSNLPAISGANQITTDPRGAYIAPSPKEMNDQQQIDLARKLRTQGLNKDQIIQWFAARGVTIEP